MLRLWHILSSEKLALKEAHARKNRGALLLTPPCRDGDLSKGKIRACLSCLKTPVSGFDFTAGNSPRMIYIDLDPAVRRYRHTGDPGQIDWPDIAQRYDYAEICVHHPSRYPTRYTEVLLFTDRLVKRWGAEPQVVSQDFMQHYSSLLEGRISPDQFYLNDLKPLEQKALVDLLSAGLGYGVVAEEERREYASLLRSAFERIGMLRPEMGAA